MTESTAEHAKHLRGARGVVAKEPGHQSWQHGNNHAEREDIEHDGDKDEDERGAMWSWCGG